MSEAQGARTVRGVLEIWNVCQMRFGNLFENAGHEDVSKSARFAILNGHGEMAERLKAAVC